jgi:Family of unknown function (DUF6065)
MKLIAYIIDGHSVKIRPAPVERQWMDRTGDRFAYRCLPLNIANAFGWEILCNAGFTASWNGGNSLDAIKIEHDSATTPVVTSHFGGGILTFHVPCIFRTTSGDALMVQGPINRPKDGIAALSGEIETDWAPYGFTMNWIFTRPGVVRFETDEPCCHFFPVCCDDVEDIKPELRLLSDDSELRRQHEAWASSRGKFNSELGRPGSEAHFEKWQKAYYRGVDPDGHSAATQRHRTRLRLLPFRSC